MPMSTAFGCYDSVAATNGAIMPLPPGVKCVQMQQQHEKKPPSNLLYVLKNIKPVLSDVVPQNDPCYELIKHLRQDIVVTYLDIIYSLWTHKASKV